MKATVSWLKEYTDINVDARELADRLTLSGSKVESLETLGNEISNVVTGKILSVEKHPNADKLVVTKVDVGSEVIQIVTGAPNVREGDCVPVALDGATLPGGIKIKRARLRGIESNGMMCSIEELGLTRDNYPDAPEDGIYVLPPDTPLGKDIKDVLGLNDTIIEFEITSNRPDCFSVVGLARETAATLDAPFRYPEILVKEDKNDNVNNYVKVTIEEPELCPRYAARVIKNVRIGPSPKWMRDRLVASGVRPINNIVDITNYVMLEMGQPMHAFNLKDVEGGHIIVRRAREGETIQTLDGQDRKLDPSMLVISDEKRAIAVAGVMGGANSEITNDSGAVLFESANFNGTSVRLTAKKLNLRTEASGRYEKGLDPNNVLPAINRAAQLVEMLGAGEVVGGVVDVYPVKPEPRTIKFRPEKINALLGTDISKEEMIRIFRKLELVVDEENMIITVPTFRPDLEREADLAEEVARFHDYNNITPTLLSGKSATQGRKTYQQKMEDRIKDFMVAQGYSETYTYSFTSPKVFDALRLPKDSPLRRAVVISNPLGEDYSIMRTTTIPEMLKSMAVNYNRRAEEVRLFELSKVYVPKALPLEELPDEPDILTIGLYGNCDFYDLKGTVEELLENLGITKYEMLPEKDNPTFHPGRTAKLIINGEESGILGEIHPDVAENFEIGTKAYVAVIPVARLIEESNITPAYKPLPRFPSVTRDIAILVKDDVMVKQIEDIIKQKAGNLLENLTLFDVYKGKQIEEGYKSVAYSITFRAEDRTLTDEEVNKLFNKIVESLRAVLNAQLRV